MLFVGSKSSGAGPGFHMVYNFLVTADPKISEFIEKALAAGIPQESLVGVLTARGWGEKDVYDALADHYQRLTGLDVPRRLGAGASAKEAFFYLLIFSTLATWAIGFGCLAFDLIDRWFADQVFTQYEQVFETYTVTWSSAALIVAFPLYLLISHRGPGDSGASGKGGFRDPKMAHLHGPGHRCERLYGRPDHGPRVNAARRGDFAVSR